MKTPITILVGLALALGAVAKEPVKLDLEEEWRILYEEIACQMAGIRKADQTYDPHAIIQSSDRNPVDVMLRRTEAMLNDLTPDLEHAAAYRQRLDALREKAKDLPAGGKRYRKRPKKIKDARGKEISGPPLKAGAVDMGTYKEVFIAACRLNREIALANPLLRFDKLVFVKKHPPRVGHMCDQWFGMAQDPGGGLFVLHNPGKADAYLQDMLADATVTGKSRLAGRALTPGVYASPEVTYDGKQIYFAYSELTKAFSERWQEAYSKKDEKIAPWGGRLFSEEYFRTLTDSFHLFRIDADGRNLVQLTDGAEDDHSPCVLPNGRVAFVSTRLQHEGRCHPRPCPAYVLYSMLPDGSDMQPLSYHEINEWTPRVNNDGKIVYSRWDYLDRSFSDGQTPWIMNPDGSNVRVLYGNYESKFRGKVQEDLRAIPNTPLYVGVIHTHHMSAYGGLIIYDSTKPDIQEQPGISFLTPDTNSGGPSRYASPYPLNDTYFLCVWSPDSPHLTLNTWAWYRPPTPHGIYLIDKFGNRTLLYRDDEVACMAPLPLAPRKKEPIVPHQVATAVPPGQKPAHADKIDQTTVSIMDVYDSELPWPEGRKVKALRIIEVYRKTTPRKGSPSISYNGEVNARGVIGTVPVEEDGSAYFTMPTRIPVYFQALDENGVTIQSMRSTAYAMPGEVITCQGCHEPKNRTAGPRTKTPLALQRKPSTPRPVAGGRPLHFPLLVQPVLDKKCVGCHEKNKGKAPALHGGKSIWQRSAAYRSLGPYAWCYSSNSAGYAGRKGKEWKKCTNPVRSVPGKVGATEAPLYHLLTTGSHKDRVKLTAEEMERITTWLDCMSPFYGAYKEDELKARLKAISTAPRDGSHEQEASK